MIESFVFVFLLLILVIATLTDIRTHEVPDWVSYAGMGAGLFFHVIAAILFDDKLFLLAWLTGIGAGFLIGAVMFYSGQWGGGDAKMLMALGSILGLPFSLDAFFLSFLVNLLFAGAIYGIVYMGFLVYRERKRFFQEMRRKMLEENTRKYRIVVLVSCFALLLFGFVFEKNLFFMILLSFLFYGGFYLLLATKTIEKTCMLHQRKPEELREGDWIAKDVYAGEKKVCGPRDLGVTKEQILLLKKMYKQKKIQHVLVKEGMAFVPAFLLSFVLTYTVGNVLSALLPFMT